MFKHLQKLFALVLLCCTLLGSNSAFGQINVQNGSSVQQQFNDLGASATALLPANWKVSKSTNMREVTSYVSAVNATERSGGADLSTTAGNGIYNFEASASAVDRAIGFLSSGSSTKSGNLYAHFNNNSSLSITDIDVSFDVEKYRGGSRTEGFSIELYYSSNGTIWTSAGSDFKVNFSADADNSGYAVVPGAVKSVTNKTLGVTIPAGGDLYLAWNYSVTSGSTTSNAQALAIDNIKIAFGTAPADVTAPTVTSLSPTNTATGVVTTANLAITFDEAIVKGTGAIELRNAADGSLLQSIDVAGNAVAVSEKTATISANLQAATSYYVIVPAGAFADGAGNAFAGITTNTGWTFSTVATATPVLSASVQNLFFGYVAPNQTKTLTFVTNGTDITEDVAVTATGVYTLATEENGTYTTSITLTAAEAMAGKSVYVKYSPTAAATYAGTVTISTNHATNATVKLLGTALNTYAQNFDECTADGNDMVGSWMRYSITGDQVWDCTTFGYNGKGVQINGYDSGAKENQDYLISPSLDLTSLKMPIVSFWTKSDFSGPALAVMISTDYDGVSAPSTATWTALSADLPAVNSGTWKQSVVDLTSYKQPNVHIAFVYTSTTSSASRWSVDEFKINTDSYYVTTGNLNHSYGIVSPQSVSAGKSFTFSITGLEQDLTLTVPADFKLSKDGNSFSQSITYTKEQAAANNTFYVQFTPTVDNFVITGAIQFTSGTQLNITRGNLVGSSKTKESTLDIVTWNVEWFGADKDASGKELGPADEELQHANVKQAMQALNADIYALQEVSDDVRMAQLVSELDGYSFVKSDVYSYSIRETSSTLTPQKLYIVYKTATVKVKNQKVLLEKLYRDLLANTTVLPGYNPTASGTDESKDDSFWSSGRLPYLVQVEANINGVKQDIHLLNIHARANSGTDITRYNMRKYDLQVLKDSLDAQYPNVNLVMLGDYNDDVDVSVINSNESTYKAFVDDARYDVLTYELSNTGVGTYQASSFLDHISISQNLNDEYLTGSIKIEEEVTANIANYFSTTSDHYPVSARFNLAAGPVVTFTEVTATKAEGSEKFNVNLTVSAAQATEQTVTVSVVAGGTAAADDYTVIGATNGMVTVTVPANASSASFELLINDDSIVEPSEQLTLQITAKSTGLAIGASNTYTLTITDNDNTTGIADATKGQFSVYPNPLTGKEYLRLSLPERVAKLQNISLALYDINGRVIFTAKGSQQNVQQVLNAEGNSLRNGLYILKIEAGKEVFVTRMLKK
ncbi:Ig-like domain-containing protein [Pontibacter oryzae]|uniref:T9SS C-terminal target domain-containing protein n=1 Tax=Pontibacter oryzae TaxID=2304593 RepID=A0A399SJ46_9BACT|nr:Ig-like domain-containing protein [Pontibacter oryzae]RIJ42929.1 T9SS C-terminal target domain-containing protein [Pontibacter oryzae]